MAHHEPAVAECHAALLIAVPLIRVLAEHLDHLGVDALLAAPPGGQ